MIVAEEREQVATARAPLPGQYLAEVLAKEAARLLKS